MSRFRLIRVDLLRAFRGVRIITLSVGILNIIRVGAVFATETGYNVS